MSERDFPEIPIPQLQPGKQRVSWKGYESSKQRLIELATRPGVTAKEVEEHYGLGKNQIAVWKQNAKNFAKHKGEAPGESGGVASLAARREQIQRALAAKHGEGSPAGSDPSEKPVSVRSMVDQLSDRRKELLARRDEIDREIEGLDEEIRDVISALESLMGKDTRRPPPADPLEERQAGGGESDG